MDFEKAERKAPLKVCRKAEGKEYCWAALKACWKALVTVDMMDNRSAVVKEY